MKPTAAGLEWTPELIRLAAVRKAVSPEMLRIYGAVSQGDDPNGITDIEFPSVRAAVLWREDCVPDDVVVAFREPQRMLDTGQHVVIQISTR